MKKNNPNLNMTGLRHWKPADGITDKLGKKVFGVKLPLDVEQKLLEMPDLDRIALIRSTLVKAVRETPP
jgi:hypothetical protein